MHTATQGGSLEQTDGTQEAARFPLGKARQKVALLLYQRIGHLDGKRTFYTERWCYLGSIDDWIDIGPSGPVQRLARRFIPKLGSGALYEELC